MVEVFEEGKPTVVYGNINADKAKRIIVEHVVNGKPVSDYVIEVG
jgi:NADP-reducing hydrogenase subunit HndB